MSTDQPGGFRIEPIAVSAAAGSFENEAQALAKAAFTMRQRLAELGGCWGDDVVGRRFGARYEPAALTVLDNVESMALGMLRIGAALRAVSKAYLSGEQELIRPIPDEPFVEPLPGVVSPQAPAPVTVGS